MVLETLSGFAIVFFILLMLLKLLRGRRFFLCLLFSTFFFTPTIDKEPFLLLYKLSCSVLFYEIRLLPAPMLFLPVSRLLFPDVFSARCSLCRMVGLSCRRNGYCWHDSRRCNSSGPSISCRFLCLIHCSAGIDGTNQN